jgi:hypothetical protein
MYLRIVVHDNEHMAQLIAYARMNGIVSPWSKCGPEHRRSRIRAIFLKAILWELFQFAFGQSFETDLRALQDYFRFARDPGTKFSVRRDNFPPCHAR